MPLFGRRWHPVTGRRWLLERLPKASVGAEIGVWQGDFSAAILDVVQPRLLHLIDPWQRASDESHSGALFDRPQADLDGIAELVQARFAKRIAAGHVVIHRATSAAAATELGRASLDWAYVDGDHAYEAVQGDLATYAKVVRPGGFVAGDDYRRGGMYHSGVKRAVDEAVATGLLELVVQRDRQFLLRVPDKD
ncbi:MAG TPA: class I SAM-dependent methyltransferase [Candidatus Limnocylindria bacterium]|nr:class I SAM-dependent methyltransferase [Candidatus Limnocylindria bacterium]